MKTKCWTLFRDDTSLRVTVVTPCCDNTVITAMVAPEALDVHIQPGPLWLSHPEWGQECHPAAGKSGAATPSPGSCPCQAQCDRQHPCPALVPPLHPCSALLILVLTFRLCHTCWASCLLLSAPPPFSGDTVHTFVPLCNCAMTMASKTAEDRNNDGDRRKLSVNYVGNIPNCRGVLTWTLHTWTRPALLWSLGSWRTRDFSTRWETTA